MKLEVNVDKKYFFAIVLIGLVVIGIVGVIAYGTNNPTNFGHTIGEINWGETIPSIVATNISANKVCIAGDCRAVWPTGFVDTKCNVAGSCSQVCIGSDCRTSWPTGGNGPQLWGSSSNNIYYLDSPNSIGRVGIGTMYPNAKLSFGALVNNTKPAIAVYDDNAGAFYGIGAMNSPRWALGFWTHTATTPKMVIDLNGNVGIGTTAPDAKLDVAGNTRITGNLTVTGQISSGSIPVQKVCRCWGSYAFTFPVPNSWSRGTCRTYCCLTIGGDWGMCNRGAIGTEFLCFDRDSYRSDGTDAFASGGFCWT